MMKSYIDQIGRKLELEYLPKRIVSLVPSQTEYFYALGMEERIVGITKFCIHPKAWFKTKERVGGTKNVDIKKVLDLKPDFIVANKEENRAEDIKALGAIVPTYVSDVNSIEDAYQMMADLGAILGCSNESMLWIEKWKEYFNSKQYEGAGRRVIYVIWKDPIMLVGPGTYIHSYITKLGYQNEVAESRYPRLTECNGLNPEEVLLSTEPYPFKKSDILYFKQRFPNANIRLVDGEEFSWYGVRNVI
jgi:ABC-type Fe3+-hydroxamate transport system substrate-binding protein